MSFDCFSFDPLIKAGIVSAGYSTPTPIQSQTIQPVLDGRDVLGLAQTGTGKTAAFVLPILQRLLRGVRGKPRALILSPTRELAEQTHGVIKELGRQTRQRSVTLYGGVSAQPQIQSLRAGIDIAVACPGRLLDLYGQRAIDLSGIQILVLDEADQMFDMGFLPSIRRILAALPEQRQTLLFSATMPAEIRDLAMEFLVDPVTVEIGHSRPVECVRQAIYPVEQNDKLRILLSLLEDEQDDSGQVLIFTRTKHRAKKLALQLTSAGLAATSLQGNLSQNQRQASMDRFRSGRVKVMVATDIAARGIDVTQVSHVINYDVPDTAEAYTHRIGRTGRMSRLGTAFTLATPEDVPMIRAIERLLNHPLERLQMAGYNAPAFPVTPSEPQRPAPRSTGARQTHPTRPTAAPSRASRGPRPESRPRSEGQRAGQNNNAPAAPNRPPRASHLDTSAESHSQNAPRPRSGPAENAPRSQHPTPAPGGSAPRTRRSESRSSRPARDRFPLE